MAHCIEEEINYKFQIHCGTELAAYVPLGSFEMSDCVMVILYTEYMAPAAVTANGPLKVTYIPLEWLFFLKDMTPPYTHAFIISADPSSCYKEA
jgi:hypothetical protein